MNLKLLRSQFLITLGLLLTFCLIFFEAPPRLKKFYLTNILKFENSVCKNINIKNVIFEYGSCPNTKYFREGDSNDKNLNFVTSYTDSIGGRVDQLLKGKNFNSEDYKIYLIGDSFIQADELIYEKTIYGIINKFQEPYKGKAYGFGMGSWNSKEYLQSIKAINAKNSLYDIYFYANDFTPNDHRPRSKFVNSKNISNLNKTDFKKNSFVRIKEKSKEFLNFLANNTFTLKKVREIYYSKKFDLLYKDQISLVEFNKKNISNCAFIKNYENKVTKYMFDYLVLSLPYNCWDKEYKDTYSLVLKDIKKMIHETEKRDSKIRFIFIPPGFSFKGEFSPGRNHHRQYGQGIPTEEKLKLIGLTEKLNSDLGPKFIDLDYPIRFALEKYKSQKNCKKLNCNNVFYFANDGHLNSKGHEFLYEYLYKNKI